jgi:hypothetical protein
VIRVVWDGMADLKSGLTALPADLAAGAIPLARAAAHGAAASIRANYPHVSGELAGGVSVLEQPIGPFGVTFSVMNTTWWANVYERGSKARWTKGKRGKKSAYRGYMPAAPASRRFGPRIAIARRDLQRELVALMERQGLTVRDAA